ncbi:MAG: T9SS type A sorting domain-containing protein [Bacteroidia bacterium]|nr:T9SS type A sorting domain-containing protein [Bacteroidia bacterium]
MIRIQGVLLFLLNLIYLFGQTYGVAYDTLTFIHNSQLIKYSTAGGLNSSLFYDGDFNQDGKKDFVIFELGGPNKFGAYKCFLNKGTASQPKYEYDYRLSRSFPLTQNWAVITDYNSDGKPDLFVSVTAGIRAFKNLGYQNGEIMWKLEKNMLMAIYAGPTNTLLSNIYASGFGYPAIYDLDGDGDLDLLSFGPTGNFLDAFKNISKETYNHTDSLVFQHWDYCWGKFSEYNCYAGLNACRSGGDGLLSKRHAGAALVAYDHDGNSTPDLLLHDIGCNSAMFLLNGGNVSTPLITDTTVMFPNYPVKNSTRRLRMFAGCKSTLADINGDGKKELLVTPSIAEFENKWSVWRYNNISTTPTVNWQFSDSAFIQSQMVDAGFMARPVLIDLDADGKKDLLIGTHGTYSNGIRVPYIHYYRNVGSVSAPVFSLVSSNFLNLATAFSSTVSTSIYVCPGDIDTDGDDDLILSVGGRIIHWYENTAGAGMPCNFSQLHLNPFGIQSSFDQNYQPFVFDYDNDNKPDLILGLISGKFLFFKNTTTSGMPTFSQVPNAFPQTEADGDYFVYGNNGYSCPYIWKENNQIFMLAGNTTGKIYRYQMPSMVTASATLIDSSFAFVYTGTYSTPWYEDINGDGKRDLLVGNSAGGITFFSSLSPFVGIKEEDKSNREFFKIFPNPAHDEILLELDEPNAKVYFTGVDGKIFNPDYLFQNGKYHIKTNFLPDGFYILNLVTESGIYHRACIVRHP